MRWLGWVMRGITAAHGAVAAIIGLVGIAAAALRWLKRRLHPAAAQSVEPVEFISRTRQALIERVWAQRIANGLDHSLRHAAEMRLELQNVPELIKLSYAQSTAAPGELLTIEEAYSQAGTQLAILGAPGSGKTTEALKLMRGLLNEARLDDEAPVPEIFPLSSWAKERKPILDWLADQIWTRHGRPLSEARSLVWQHQVVPVLDGLDEVAAEHRAECVEAINRFWDDHRGGPLVLCSRQAEYKALPEQVKLGGAVTVRPPEPGEIDRYLKAAGAQWEGVRAYLRDEAGQVVRELLSTPLMLSVAVLAYEGADPMELCAVGEPVAQRDRLWARYISTVTSRSYVPTAHTPEGRLRYDEAQVRRWLGWLAKEMASRNETELWLHEWSGAPSWRKGVKIALALFVALPFALAKGVAYGYSHALGLAFGLTAGLAAGAGLGIAIALTFRVNVGLAPTYRKLFDRTAVATGLAMGLAVALVVGLVGGLPSALPSRELLGDLAYAMAFGLMGGLISRLNVGPTPIQPKPLNRSGLAVGLAIGLAVAVVVGLMSSLVIRLAVELAYGLAYGLAFLVKIGPAPTYRRPFDRSAVAAGVVAGLALGIALGIAVGLSLGAAAGLTFGLIAAPAIGLEGALAFGLLGVGQERERVIIASPRQAIRTSGRLGMVFGLAVAAVTGLALGMSAGPDRAPAAGLLLGLVFGIALGIAAALVFGLDAVAFHYAFCLWLRIHQLGPWDWPGFLHWASDRMLLRTNGASYQWIHLELRDYLALKAVQGEYNEMGQDFLLYPVETPNPRQRPMSGS